MPDTNLPTTIAVGIHTEAPAQVTARRVSDDRVMLTIGGDLAGVQIVGRLDLVRQIAAQAIVELDAL